MQARVSLPLLPRAAPAPALPPRSVRLSLTDRCDLACVYCRPHRTDGYLDERLDEDAFRTMALGLVQSGVRRVRITGGEPLLHPRVTSLVAFLASLRIDDLAMTTNATQLDRLAAPLREAGLRRLTISLDSLDEARFWRMTRGGRLAQVLAGIEAACAAGFEELKLNAVVLRGENDDELEALVRFAWERGMTPRFIEVMKVGEGAAIADRALVPVAEMRDRLAHLLVDEHAVADADRGPARYVRSQGDASLRVGFISGTSDTYCGTCDRLRVSSDGELRPCLATNDGVSARGHAERGDVAGIGLAIQEAWAKKPDGATFKGCTEPSAAGVSMRAIGGLPLPGHVGLGVPVVEQRFLLRGEREGYGPDGVEEPEQRAPIPGEAALGDGEARGGVAREQRLEATVASRGDGVRVLARRLHEPADQRLGEVRHVAGDGDQVAAVRVAQRRDEPGERSSLGRRVREGGDSIRVALPHEHDVQAARLEDVPRAGDEGALAVGLAEEPFGDAAHAAPLAADEDGGEDGSRGRGHGAMRISATSAPSGRLVASTGTSMSASHWASATIAPEAWLRSGVAIAPRASWDSVAR